VAPIRPRRRVLYLADRPAIHPEQHLAGYCGALHDTRRDPDDWFLIGRTSLKVLRVVDAHIEERGKDQERGKISGARKQPHRETGRTRL
jgi:hypothetical protein